MPSSIITQQTKDAPDLKAVSVGTPVFGSTLQAIGDCVNHLAFCKSRRISNTIFSINHHNTWLQNQTVVDAPTYNIILKSYLDNEMPASDTKDIIFTCSSSARFIGFNITYNCDGRNSQRDLAKIKCSLVSSPRSIRTEIDAGMEATILNGYIENTSFVTRSTSHDITVPRVLSSSEYMEVPITGSYTTITSPRPLFIPVANRGSEIALVIETNYCRILAVSLIEMYEEVVL